MEMDEQSSSSNLANSDSESVKLEFIRKRLEKYRYCHTNVNSSVDLLEKFNNLVLEDSNSDSQDNSAECPKQSAESKISKLSICNGLSSHQARFKLINDHIFQSSTSSFNKKDMEVLSIIIKEVYRLDDFLKYSHISVETEEKEVLGNIAKRAGEYECGRFDLELDRVLDNNKCDKYYYSSTNESYIDSLADTIFRISNVYDGQRFELLKPKNSLYICNRRYGSSVDRELRIVRTGMVFMVEESKHVSTSSYLKGDLQLACNLLVSHQQNRNKSIEMYNLSKPLPTVFAMKMLATEVFLYFMNYDEEYLEYLEKGYKKKEIVMYKLLYNHSSIDISYTRHMEILLNILFNIGEAVSKL